MCRQYKSMPGCDQQSCAPKSASTPISGNHRHRRDDSFTVELTQVHPRLQPVQRRGERLRGTDMPGA
jgi:hypothetical protein